MTGREKLLEFAQKRKIFRSSEIQNELNLPRTYLSQLLAEGLHECVSYSLYSLADSDFNRAHRPTFDMDLLGFGKMKFQRSKISFGNFAWLIRKTN